MGGSGRPPRVPTAVSAASERLRCRNDTPPSPPPHRYPAESPPRQLRGAKRFSSEVGDRRAAAKGCSKGPRLRDPARPTVSRQPDSERKSPKLGAGGGGGGRTLEVHKPLPPRERSGGLTPKLLCAGKARESRPIYEQRGLFEIGRAPGHRRDRLRAWLFAPRLIGEKLPRAAAPSPHPAEREHRERWTTSTGTLGSPRFLAANGKLFAPAGGNAEVNCTAENIAVMLPGTRGKQRRGSSRCYRTDFKQDQRRKKIKTARTNTQLKRKTMGFSSF